MPATAAETPAIMLFVGRLGASEGLRPVVPGAEDRVLVFSTADGSLVGDGVVGRDGRFQAAVTKTASFNGTPLALEFQQGRRRYALLRADGSPAWMRFAGRLLPERTLLDLRIGAQTAELEPDAGPRAQRLTRRVDVPCDALADVNEDGRCDEQDWAILRRYGGGVTRTVGNP